MNKVMLTWIGVAIAGALGSVARFGVSEVWKLATRYPAGTLTVNLVGAFALGWVNTKFLDAPESAFWRYTLGVGLLGGFTTFSSMMFDSDRMMNDAQYFPAAAYLGLSVFLGMVAVRAGVMVAKGI